MVVRSMLSKATMYALSDIGPVRQNNEDVWASAPQDHFYALADGMGGHQAGEVAAQKAVDGMRTIVHDLLGGKNRNELSKEEVSEIIRNAIITINHQIFEDSLKKTQLRGMGTTLCCLYFHDSFLVFAHVGDSRIYRIRKSRITLLTKDHSLLRELVEMGRLNEQQATDFLYKNIITRAIGTEPFVEPDVQSESYEKQDIYLMCSDGLTDVVSDEEIEKIINSAATIKKAAEDLIAAALEKRGSDNITVLLVQV